MPQEQIQEDLAKRMTKNRRLLKDILDMNIDEAIEVCFQLNKKLSFHTPKEQLHTSFIHTHFITPQLITIVGKGLHNQCHYR